MNLLPHLVLSWLLTCDAVGPVTIRHYCWPVSVSLLLLPPLLLLLLVEGRSIGGDSLRGADRAAAGRADQRNA